MKFNIFEKYGNILHTVTQKDDSYGYSFSMSMHTKESKDEIQKNRDRLKYIFGSDAKYFSVFQIHGNIVHTVKEYKNHAWKSLEEDIKADALITNIPNQVLCILTADCVPILIYDRVKNVVAAIHAGWKGTKEKIVQNTISSMKTEYGSSTKSMIVGIAPAIGECCYEVSDEIANDFEQYPDCMSKNDKGKYQLDLKQINYRQLLEAGVKSKNIEMSAICTACHSDKYFSYRKEQGCSGRFMSAIMIEHS